MGKGRDMGRYVGKNSIRGGGGMVVMGGMKGKINEEKVVICEVRGGGGRGEKLGEEGGGVVSRSDGGRGTTRDQYHRMEGTRARECGEKSECCGVWGGE
jgi:hypothetical protein